LAGMAEQTRGETLVRSQGMRLHKMPVADIEKRRLAQHYLLYKSVCRYCGATNPLKAKRCRKCKTKDLRPKRRSRR
ncbi:MAG: hypothetical protein V3T87_01550, partial [Candidatus Thorarchaeota archaeon]